MENEGIGREEMMAAGALSGKWKHTQSEAEFWLVCLASGFANWPSSKIGYCAWKLGDRGHILLAETNSKFF